MNIIKKYILLFGLILISFLGKTQNPAHFYIGQGEFSNAHVYSLKYHPNGLLYAATNYGLYVYKNGKFNQVPIGEDYAGRSLFSLKFDSKKNLFCTTLSGKVFKLLNDSLVLYSTIPKDYINKYMVEIAFDDKDNLITKSKVLAIYKNKKWKKISSKNERVPVINGVNPKAILYSSTINSEIWNITNEKAKVVHVSRGNPFSLKHHTFAAYFENQLIGISIEGLFFNYKTGEKYHLTDERVEVKQTDDREVWLLSRRKGFQRLLSNNEEVFLSEKYFKNQFISCITISKAGVIFLGTFNHGIIVIPNINALEYQFQHGQIEGSVIVPNNEVSPEFKRKVSLHKRLALINLTNNKAAILIGRDRVFYEKGVDFGFNTKDSSLLVQDVNVLMPKGGNSDMNGDLGSFKDLQRVDKNLVLIATSKGLLKAGKGLDYINWAKNGTGNKWWSYNKEHFRCKTVAYISSTKSIYYTNYGVLHKIDSNGIDKVVMFEGGPVKCADIFATDSLAICATHKNGILFIKNGVISSQLSKKDGLLDNFVKKIIKHNNKLYIASRTTFQIYDLHEKKWSSLGQYHNVIKGSVSGILVSNSTIGLTSGDKIVVLPLNDSVLVEPYSFNITNVYLGDSVFNGSTKISTPYNQNKFVAELDFRGLLYENQVEIEYRLNKSAWKNIKATSSKIEYIALKPNNYQLDIRLNDNGIYKEEQSIKFQILSPFWERWWFYLICVLALVLIITLIAFSRVKKIQKVNDEQIEKQKLKANLLDTELKALRSQMNPHFIFNSLNSIQDLILKEDTDGSYDYVVLFANLVRNTLNYSNKDFIPIEKELDFLEVYLKLEKLRFGDEFTYEIDYEGNDGVELPSLIVQPFIENALIHGLLHKTGNKKLSIHFKMDDRLKCTIIDNGVGRKKSQEIHERQGGGHESFALQAIEKRLSILSNKDEDAFGYIVTDLYEGTNPSGTKIEVTIPHRLLY